MPRTVCLLLASLVLLAGCGPSGPRTYRVSGVVTYNGEPVSEGDIVFIPEDPALGADAGRIVKGSYETEAKAGVCRVEISAVEIGPDTPRIDGVPVVTNYLPERYNTQSELSVEVQPNNRNSFDFNLTSD